MSASAYKARAIDLGMRNFGMDLVVSNRTQSCCAHHCHMSGQTVSFQAASRIRHMHNLGRGPAQHVHFALILRYVAKIIPTL